MTPYARSGLAMIGLVTAMCGAVIVATHPLRRRMEENELASRNDPKGTARCPT